MSDLSATYSPAVFMDCSAPSYLVLLCGLNLLWLCWMALSGFPDWWFKLSSYSFAYFYAIED
jgi:hypothetical protein